MFTAEIIFVLAVLLAAIVLFATEKLRVDTVALIVMAVLLISGLFFEEPIVTAEEGISGFSNTATVTVAAMFIISAALFKTGGINFLGVLLSQLIKRSLLLSILAIMVCVGVISAFINNTPAVAVFLPIIMGAAKEAKVSPAKLLMPLSFASMFGGVCTLIGTSTNILVSSIAVRHGQEAFSMFEFAPLGIIFFVIGIIYMLLIGVRIIPNRILKDDLTESYEMSEYLTEIVLLPEAKSVGMRIMDSPLVKELDIDVTAIYRNDGRFIIPHPNQVLQAGDILRVRCDIKRIKELQNRTGVELKSDRQFKDEDFKSEESKLIEAVISPNSKLVGTTLKKSRFRSAFGATALAIKHRGQVIREKIGSTVLSAGDTLLIEVRKTRLDALKQNSNFIFVSEVGLPEYRRGKLLTVLAIITGVIALAAANILPIVVTAIAGAVLLIVTRCIDIEEAYEAIEWKVIFLLAGVLSLGVALEKSGTADLIAGGMISVVGDFGPYALVAAFYILTSMLTESMSNNATAALLAPIAIVAAEAMGIDARPLLMAVTFAASASFMTPVGYQTNTMIFGPGEFKFMDFIRVGTPLNIIFFIVATIMIPIFWPF